MLAEELLVAPMPDKGDLSELNETLCGGEPVLMRRARSEDMAYPDLHHVSVEDLRLRFFGRIPELSAAEIDKLTELDYRHEMAFIALDENTSIKPQWQEVFPVYPGNAIASCWVASCKAALVAASKFALIRSTGILVFDQFSRR